MKGLHSINYYDAIAIIKALERVKERPAILEAGICDNLEAMLYYQRGGCIKNLKRALILLYREFSNWPRFSGNIIFPVPCPYDQEENHGYTYERIVNKWEGRYGALRYELLDFLIERLIEALPYMSKDIKTIEGTQGLIEN